ncbi:hypothetical protein FQ187_02085 [Pseudomonas sp. ANT_J28]|nr:hypothetical protein FQ187_02085 [Pseudomonas sp. ANT_J28]
MGELLRSVAISRKSVIVWSVSTQKLLRGRCLERGNVCECSRGRQRNPCGSELAREDVVSVDINVECHTAFASKLTPTGIVSYRGGDAGISGCDNAGVYRNSST